ncbi:MAG: radical SAM protein [Peptostreptococcales bacterium]
MRYEGTVYRPPSEARSLIIQITIGCANNTCTFCSMYIDKKFRIRKLEEVIQDLEAARRYYRYVERIFLADGDALVLKTEHLILILDKIKELFPECKRVGIYGTPKDILRKSLDELNLLYEHGLSIVYMGVESGSEAVITATKKGVPRADMVKAGRKLKETKIKLSITLISGLGGKALTKEHGAETGKIIGEISPDYVGVLTLMLDRDTEMRADLDAGRFELLSPLEVLEETEDIIKNIDLKPGAECVFRMNHASNYLSLKGTLPQDKEMLLAKITSAKKNVHLLKDDMFRML